ncbi:TonB-dependent receptor [Alteromonas oceanisediminis]|uniref:TonB-dependent receptor n=1 Tax=Alteromonas oceanisediminis TaxID=2836180 RepID=UPI001BD97C14|nr:TonB-dependent receptor [Alteromonas oceanisediminis]MBT0587414.1 TonB-dependent receptor [Alteromonas oceanisediminis]
MKSKLLIKSRLATAVSLVFGAAATASVLAQEADTENASAAQAEQNVEVIQVQGIRGSLIRSMDIKRSSAGVVDAISAEEMGKFPDTNLAESLQRITGVSVSRSNGEGSQITVRGFGPDFNLITLNGRQMPGTGNTRSYNLENLSSEGINALEVYKTARAELPSGGLGATVNIVTAKPLSNPGLKYSISAKGIYDSSNEKGDDVTPEVAAIYSDTFADDTFGISLSASHQVRHFQQQGAAIDGWKANVALPNLDEGDFIDPRAVDAEGNRIGNHFLPQNLGYTVADFERSRTNGQLTLQYAPTDDLTLSLDYTASEAETGSESTSFGVWFNFGGNINSYELDERGTAIRFNEANNDYAHTVRKGTTKVTAESIGFNMDWNITDSVHVELDYHDSSNKVDDGADKGSGNNGFIILGPNNLVSKTYDFSQGDIPQMELFWPDNNTEAQPVDFDSQFAQFFNSPGESTVEQLQLDSTWISPYDTPLMRIKAGVAYTDQNIGGRFGFSGNQGIDGYDGVQAILPDQMFTRNDTGDFLDQFAGGGADLLTNYYYTYDYDEAIARHIAFYGDDFVADAYADGIDSETNVQEETLSAYLQAELEFDLYDMPAFLNLGLRYEETDVTSTVRQRVEDKVVWTSSTEWVLQYQDIEDTFVVAEGEHDLLLPTMDFSLEITEDVIGRLSYGKTISRAPLGNLAGIRTLSSNPKPGARSGSSGNTNLQPFESTNFDVSLEWYYDEGSYAAIGYFKKDVKNFIQTDFNTITVDGLYDIIGGPRYLQAEADIAARGEQVTVEAIFNQIIANGGGNGNGQIEQSAADPLIEWLVSQPTNGDTKAVDGIEFAVQHLFGETGFGAGVNATFVNGDVEFDVNSLSVQSPLVGLSDSANFQLFYENHGVSVKVTYAWRDSYLLGVGQAAGSADAPPQFAKEYGQWDVSANYDVTDELTVFFEGINLNNETEEIYGRYEEQFLAARQYGTRYMLGARYTF